MKKKVLITSRSFASLSRKPLIALQEAGFEAINIGGDFKNDNFERLLPVCDALVAGAHEINPELLACCPNLKIICKNGAGIDNIPLDTAQKLGITVTNAPGANADSVADLAFGLMIACARGIVRSYAHIKQGQKGRETGRDVCRKTLSLIGFGKVAQCVARRAQGFNMAVIAYDPYVKLPLPEEFSFVTMCGLNEALAQGDFISLHLSLTKETKGMMNSKAFSLMKKDAYLINTARGSIIDEEALIESIRSGRLAGAGLDVTVREPLPKDDPLLSFPQILITDHIGMYSEETINAIGMLCTEAILDYFSGKKPRYAVI